MATRKKRAVQKPQAEPPKPPDVVWCTRCHTPRDPQNAAACVTCGSDDHWLSPVDVVSKEKLKKLYPNFLKSPTMDIGFCPECYTLMVRSRTGWVCPEFHGKIIMPRHAKGMWIARVVRLVMKQRSLAHFPRVTRGPRRRHQVWYINSEPHRRITPSIKQRGDIQGWFDGRIHWYRPIYGEGGWA